MKAFELLMALVVSALVINWAMIKPRAPEVSQEQQTEGVEPKFKAFWYPFGNYLCLAFMAGILGHHVPDSGHPWISVLLIPVWIVVLAIGYQLKQKRRARVAANLSAPPRYHQMPVTDRHLSVRHLHSRAPKFRRAPRPPVFASYRDPDPASHIIIWLPCSRLHTQVPLAR